MPTSPEMSRARPAAGRDPQQPAEHAEDGCLGEELGDDVAATGADRPAMPISRTATSMTLATPMPPTTRLMAAIAVISRVELVEEAWLAWIRLVGPR